MKNQIVTSLITTLFLAQLAFAHSALADSVVNTDGNTNSEKTQNTEDQDFERIQVIGQLPASHYRAILHKAEDNFFDMFNALSNKDEFKVTCERKTKHAFTRLRERVCEAKFVSMIDSEDVASKRKLQSGRQSLVTNKASRIKKYKEMAQKQATYMVEMINSNEKLRNEYLKLADAKQKFENAKNRG